MPVVIRFIAILTGSIILAIGIDFFLVPFKILDGGIIGIALILQYTFQIKTGLSMILLSMPIYMIVWYQNRQVFYHSLLGLLISSLLIDLLYPYQFYFTYYIRLSSFVSSVIGGILVGIGIGVMLRQNASTGGADLLALFLSKILKVNVGVLIFIFDSIIISLGGLLLSSDTFYLSIITVTTIGLVTSMITSSHGSSS